LRKLQAIIECEAPDVSDIPGILDRLDDYYLYDGVDSDSDLGYYHIHEIGGFNLDSMGELAQYLDYSSYGRDVRLNSSGGGFTQYGWLEVCC